MEIMGFMGGFEVESLCWVSGMVRMRMVVWVVGMMEGGREVE